ncbi:MAG: hypothetical protein H3Z50_04515 [archaeon]|nr:hypothetical protein [archaeon]MCP8306786.1 hypothetical protein [archaeon]
MPLFEKPHVRHEKHLCSIVESGATLDEYKKLVRNAKSVCKQCGRVAAKEENLCDPVPL